jgi:hypothetical protein
MADDDLGSDGDSGNVETDDEFSMRSEDENNSESLNLGEVILLVYCVSGLLSLLLFLRAIMN